MASVARDSFKHSFKHELLLKPARDKKATKPNTEHLEATLKALVVNPEEAIVVGDGPSDMKCAKELEAIAVSLPTEFRLQRS